MTISVALCTYNGAKFLSKQIDSILNQQDYNVDEIVVCDDISSDETVAILEEYQKKYPTVFKIHINEDNLGSTKNFEKSISMCNGDYIFLADQDDIWKQDKIKKTLQVFETHPDAEGVFSNADLIDDYDNLIENKSIWESVFFYEKELQKPIDLFDIILKNGNIVTGATFCFKKSVKDFIFPFSHRVLHDEWIAMLLSLRETLYYSTENLISYRIHSNQQVGMKNLKQKKKKLRRKRLALKLGIPKSFSDYRFLQKKIYLKFKKTCRLQEQIKFDSNISYLVEVSFNEYSDFCQKFKSKFPIRYRFIQLIDTINGKRKTNLH